MPKKPQVQLKLLQTDLAKVEVRPLSLPRGRTTVGPDNAGLQPDALRSFGDVSDSHGPFQAGAVSTHYFGVCG